MEEGTSPWPGECQSCFNISLTKEKKNDSGKLVNSNRTQSQFFLSLIFTRPRWHWNLICVLCVPWYLVCRSLHFLSNLLKYNNCPCLPVACVGDKEHSNMSLSIKARKGVVTREVLKRGDKPISFQVKARAFSSNSKAWESKGCPLQVTVVMTTASSVACWAHSLLMKDQSWKVTSAFRSTAAESLVLTSVLPGTNARGNKYPIKREHPCLC